MVEFHLAEASSGHRCRRKYFYNLIVTRKLDSFGCTFPYFPLYCGLTGRGSLLKGALFIS